jgi:CubicO group peptidase (beta-lactamase class C family)
VDVPADLAERPLVPLPPQPDGVPWPTGDWPTGPVPAGVALDPLLDEVMDPTGGLARTRAVVVVHRGRLVAERYGDRTDTWGAVTGEPIDEETPLLSWSMAKSMLHAVVGMLVAEGRLDLDAPAPVPAWASPGDPRSGITLQQLLEMRDGLDFTEDYAPDDEGGAGVSHVIDMLFGPGEPDTAGFAAARPPAHPPGTVFNYSSGTSNIVSGIVARTLGSEDAYRRFLHDRLFGPIGMRSADPRFDAAGTWVASSYLWATARDMARFGTLYLRDGTWDGRRLLPEGWVDHARRPRSVDPEDDRYYGAHWWVVGDDLGTFWANGYEGQAILVCPGLDLVVVRLGKSSVDRYPALAAWRAAVVEAFRRA